MDSLEEQLLNVNVILISAGAWFILWVLRKVWTGMDRIKLVKQLKPLYPAILCEGLVWIPGALPAESDLAWGSRILMGLWCGFLASIGYQMLQRFLGNKGIVLPENPEDIIPSSDKEDDKPEDKPDEKEAAPEKPEDPESRITPVETPIPRGTATSSSPAAVDVDDGEDKEKEAGDLEK